MNLTVFDLLTNRMLVLKSRNAESAIHEPLWSLPDDELAILLKDQHFKDGFDAYRDVFYRAKESWIGVSIRTESPSPGTMVQQYGIVRAILPIIDELAVTYRLLCEEDMHDQRNGRTGGWFIANPEYVTLIDDEPLDGPISISDRIKYYSPTYRQSVSEVESV